jgi:pyridoxal phosphate enzyme (YggS family)
MSVASNLASIHARIDSACRLAGRNPADVTLIAVSKNQPASALLEAYEAGQRHFGESRLQEAQPKIEALPEDVIWHFIGTLQSNKAKKIGTLFSAIHTLDKQSQLAELAKIDGHIDGLIEVNIANEPQKSGVPVKLLDDFRKQTLNCKSIHFRGLMTIGPAEADPESTRSYFQQLRELNEAHGGQWLSMGMSSDFDVAIQEGSTHIRVGTAIFGERRRNA